MGKNKLYGIYLKDNLQMPIHTIWAENAEEAFDIFNEPTPDDNYIVMRIYESSDLIGKLS